MTRRPETAGWWRQQVHEPARTVFEQEPDRETGLLDSQGRRILRARQPIGFRLGPDHGPWYVIEKQE